MAVKTMSTRLYIFSVAIFMILSQRLYASPQMPDYIIFKGDTIVTYNLILEHYLQKTEIIESEKLFGLSFRDGSSTSCWRGYQAIYKVENDSLFLVAVLACGELGNGVIDKAASINKMKTIFGREVRNEQVLVSWFSGDLNFPLNNRSLRWDGVFYEIHEEETVVSVDAGKVVSVKNVNNYVDDPKAIDRRDKSKIPNILFRELKKVKWQSSDECDCSEKYLITIDDAGMVSKVRMSGYDADEIDQFWDRDDYEYCINTIRNGLQKLKFDIIKDKGKPISEDIYLEIWITERGKIENWTF